MHHLRSPGRLAVLLALLPLAGCGLLDSDASNATIELQLLPRAGGAAIQLDGTTYTNAAGNEFTVEKFEWLLTDLALVRDDGLVVQYDGPFYGTVGDEETLELVLEELPEGNYTHLRFHWGVPEHKNATGAFPGEFDGMLWPEPMGGGYHCMRLEGDWVPSGGGSASYAVHTGRLQMAGTERVTNGAFQVELAMPVVLDLKGTERLEMAIDILGWFDDPLYDFNATVGSHPLSGPTMPNHEAQALLKDNRGDVFVLGIAD